jgi:hypothetical protein
MSSYAGGVRPAVGLIGAGSFFYLCRSEEIMSRLDARIPG